MIVGYPHHAAHAKDGQAASQWAAERPTPTTPTPVWPIIALSTLPP
jgi:hypothetical protein